MTREELQRIIDSKPYDFLRTNPNLGKQVMFLSIVAAMLMDKCGRVRR